MKTAVVEIKGVTPYSQGRNYDTPKKNKENPRDYEERTWRDRLHVNDEGKVFIPAMAFKLCIAEAAKYLSEQIPGKGKTTYTKHFEAGIAVPKGMVLPYKKEEAIGEWIFVPSDGQRGSGKRVWKCFPKFDDWGGKVTFLILDDVITEEVFRRTLVTAGLLIGIGRFRPRNGGDYGRFEVTNLTWSETS